MSHVSVGGERHDRHVRRSRPAIIVLSADLDRVLEPGDDELGWLAKSGPAGARLPRRRGEDGAHVSRDRRRALRGARRPGPPARRRRRRAARPRLGHDQLGRREDLRRGGRGGASRRIRPCTTASWPDGRASAGATRSSPSSGSVPATSVDDADAARQEAERHIARYKLPKAFVFVDEVMRSPSRQGRLPLGQAGRRGVGVTSTT